MDPSKARDPAEWIEKGIRYVQGYINDAGRDMPLSAWLLVTRDVEGKPFPEPMNLGCYDVEGVGEENFRNGMAALSVKTGAVAVTFLIIDWDAMRAAYTGWVVGNSLKYRTWFADLSEAEGKVSCGEFHEMPMPDIGTNWGTEHGVA